MNCPACDAVVGSDAKFCSRCGSSLSIACPSCGADAGAADKFCAKCGHALQTKGPDEAPAFEAAAPTEPSTGEPPAKKETALRGERRQVTVLFADMVGYTALSERLGEEATYEFMQPVIAEMTSTVRNEQGTVQDLAGDGLMALFGHPVTLEDAPQRACRAALSLQKRMTAVGPDLESKYGTKPVLRVGLHTGPVVVGRVGAGGDAEFTPLGDTVNLASRLESLAEPGTILLSEAMRQLVGAFAETETLGERRIKGKSAPQTVYRLKSLNEQVSRFDASVERGLTKLVGRGAELRALKDEWRRSRESARSIVITGEPGLGKSRLLYEFRKSLEEEDAFILQGDCLAAGENKPFSPFVEVVRSSFRIGDQETPSALERKLTRGLELLGLKPETSLPYVLNLLGQRVEGAEFDKDNAEIAGQRTRDVIQSMLRERCRMSPVTLFVEDLHWIDKPSEDLLTRFAEDDGPLLIVGTARPPYRAPWINGSGAGEIHLAPLSADDTAELLRERLGPEAASADVKRIVVERSEGNPLFAEEFAKFVMENEPGKDGRGRGLPATVGNLLMGRIDVLEPDSRAVLQAASVIGRRFFFDVAADAAGVNGVRAEVLWDLQERELVFPTDDCYQFKHALIQTAVYDSLLKGRRTDLHERVGELLERKHANALDEVAEDLARHFAESSKSDKAVRYLVMAGDKALRTYALDDADKYFRQALEIVEAEPECVEDVFLVDLLLKIGRVLYYQADFFGIIYLTEKHMPVVERLGDQKRLSRFLFETGYAYVFTGRSNIGKPMLERAMAIGQEIGDDESIGFAAEGLLWHYIYWEPPDHDTRKEVFRLSDLSVACGKKINEPWLIAKGMIAKAQYCLTSGSQGEARKYSLELLNYGRSSGDPRAKSLALANFAFSDAYHFNPTEAIENADEALRDALSPLDQLNLRGAKGVAFVAADRPEEGREILEEVRREVNRGGFFVLGIGIEIPYALSLVMTGEMAAGMKALQESVERYRSFGSTLMGLSENLALGEMYLQIAFGEAKADFGATVRNLGFVMKNVPFAARKARTHLRAAIEGCRKFDNQSLLARCLYDLALLNVAKKRPGEARENLEQARAAAEAGGATEILARVEDELANLGT